jgi:MFS family permease
MTATHTGSIVPRTERRVFAFLLAALLVETLFFIALSPLLPIYARELHLGRVGAGVLSASYSVGYGVAAVPAAKIVGRLGQRAVSIGGLALVAVACAGFALGRDTVLLDAARAITGAGAAAVWAGSIPWLVSLGSDSDRGRLIGLAFSAASVGAFAGPAVGALATLTGPRTTFLGLAVLILALAAAGAAAGRRLCASDALSAAGAGSKAGVGDGGATVARIRRGGRAAPVTAARARRQHCDDRACLPRRVAARGDRERVRRPLV